MKYEHLKWIREAGTDELTELALKLIVAHPETFETLIHVGPRTFTVKWEGGGSVTINVTSEQLIEFKKLNGYANKIYCIKKIRETYGVGLKEAKEISEDEQFMRAIQAEWIWPKTNRTLDGRTDQEIREKLYGTHY